MACLFPTDCLRGAVSQRISQRKESKRSQQHGLSSKSRNHSTRLMGQAEVIPWPVLQRQSQRPEPEEFHVLYYPAELQKCFKAFQGLAKSFRDRWQQVIALDASQQELLHSSANIIDPKQLSVAARLANCAQRIPKAWLVLYGCVSK